jgi:hypothetical protein
MKLRPENRETQLSEEENKLLELDRQESIIETEDHRGFGDAVRLIRLQGEMEALEKDIMHDKQRAKDTRSG